MCTCFAFFSSSSKPALIANWMIFASTATMATTAVPTSASFRVAGADSAPCPLTRQNIIKHRVTFAAKVKLHILFYFKRAASKHSDRSNINYRKLYFQLTFVEQTIYNFSWNYGLLSSLWRCNWEVNDISDIISHT